MPNEQNCPLCNSTLGSNPRYVVRESWKYVHCERCGALFLDPLPSEEALQSYYNETYVVPAEAYAVGTTRNAPEALRELGARIRHPGKLLEIGCSYGLFLGRAQMAGWEVTGIELDDAAAKHGREELGLKIFSGTLESQFANLEPPYGAIATFHVIEHTREPVAFLRHCRELLAENGVLILKTPNAASWIASATGSWWQWLCPPAHIHLFSPKTLEITLTRAGFRVERIWSRRGDANNNAFELACALGRYASSRRGKEEGSNGRTSWSNRWQVNAARAASEIAYSPFAFLVDPWLGRKGLQPELVAIARG